MAMIVKFWGVRGSIPTTAQWARLFGGNTPCVEIRAADGVFICDAGTGIRELGRDLARRSPAPKAAQLAHPAQPDTTLADVLAEARFTHSVRFASRK